MNPQCPNCSSLTVKHGKRNGVQKYICCNYYCRRVFQAEYQPKIQGIPCPKCTNPKMWKQSQYTPGRDRYWCKKCNFRVTSTTLPHAGPPCYYCARPLDLKGMHKGSQQYHCPDCDAKWSDKTIPEYCLSDRLYWNAEEST